MLVRIVEVEVVFRCRERDNRHVIGSKPGELDCAGADGVGHEVDEGLVQLAPNQQDAERVEAELGDEEGPLR